MNSRTTAVISIILVVLVGGFFLLTRHPNLSSPSAVINTTSFFCDAGKSITASFYSNSVYLSLSDGRTMTLPQAVSASGARYANADQSFVFWNKGNTAFVQENSQQTDTYANCIAVAPDPGGLPSIYENSTSGFSLRYPADFVPDVSYQYQELGPGKAINGVQFTVATSTVAGTNLSPDTYISVEQIPQAQDCSATLFVDQSTGSNTHAVTDNGVDYSVASSSGAAAGNRYDEIVYAIPGTNPCIAVRYFIHYGVLDNYPSGAVQQFDEQAVIAQFDEIRRTLIIGQ